MSRSLTALLPVHNAETSLVSSVAEILDVLPDLTSRFELVVIDDGSTDATIEMADELAVIYPQLILATHCARRGRAAAIRTGLERSVGETLFLADDPCSLAFDEVSRLWERINEHDLVLATPMPNAMRGIIGQSATASGGYWLAQRRAFAEMAHVMDDQASLVALLRRGGYSWREVAVSARSAAYGARSRGLRRLDLFHGHSLANSRAARIDESAPPAIGHKQPAYAAQLSRDSGS